MQQRFDPVLNGHQQRADIVIVSLMRTERHATTAAGHKHPVQHERVDMHVQVQRRTKALDDSHGAATAVKWPARSVMRRPQQLGQNPRPLQSWCRAPCPGRRG